MNWIRRASIILLSMSSLVFAQKDVPGSQDHPLITRYPGSVIRWYDVQAYTEFKLPIGPETGYRQIDKWLELQGKLTRIYYVLEGEKTVSEVYANYLKAITAAKFEVLAKNLFTENNTSKAVGGGIWMITAYKDRIPNSAGVQITQGSSTKGGTCYIAGKLTRPQGTVYLSLAGSQFTKDQVLFLLDILEVEDVEDDLITVDADAMSKDIDMYGKVALYGIYFDYDKATIKAESKPALDEIAKLLKKRPSLKLYVVGHTDMKGSLAYNMKLSHDRAHSVVTALVKRQGIAASRLEAHGVGPLTPVASNTTDEGRSKNRRVELVAK
ncbi:MAG: OmpA family protein [bacterium]